jgi:aminocarboxymuconate-semialdehyde decarboxylase
MKLRPDGKSVAMFGTKEFRVLDDRCWDVGRRTADMDKEHVDVQALSPMPEHRRQIRSHLEFATSRNNR